MSIGFGLSYEDQLPPTVRDELQQLTASIQSAFSPLGAWVTVTADTASFTGSGLMTWTVEARDQFVSYTMIGNTMILQFFLDATTVGGTVSTTLRMLLPAGRTAVRTCAATCQIYDNSAATSVLGQIRVTSGSRFAEFSRFDGANFTASTNLTYIRGQLACEVI